MEMLSKPFAGERINAVADHLGFNSFQVVSKLQWLRSHVHCEQVPHCAVGQCSLL